MIYSVEVEINGRLSDVEAFDTQEEAAEYARKVHRALKRVGTRHSVYLLQHHCSIDSECRCYQWPERRTPRYAY